MSSSRPRKSQKKKKDKETVTLQFRLKGASNLPKVSLWGSVDAYVQFKAGGHEFETRVVAGTKHPTWDHECFFDAERSSDGYLRGSVEFEVYDKSRFGDTHIGSAVLQLGEYHLESLSDLREVSLPIEYAHDHAAKFSKQGRDSQLLVGVLGSIISYRSLCRALKELPGAYFINRSQHIYFPVPNVKHIMAGIHYSTEAVEFKIALTKLKSTVYMDLDCGGAESTKVVKAVYQQGHPDVSELKIYEEVTTQNVTLSDEWDQSRLGCCQREVLHTFPIYEALVKAGWKGPTSKFDQAAAEDMCDSSLVDVHKQRIYTPVGPSAKKLPRARSRRLKSVEYDALLMLDYSGVTGGGGGGALSSFTGKSSSSSASSVPRLKLCVMATDANSGRAYDIHIPQGEYTVPSELFAEPLPILGETQFISRTLEVLDLTSPAVLHGAQVTVYELTECQSWKLHELMYPKPEEEPEKEEDHSLVHNATKTFEDGIGGITSIASKIGKVATTVGKTADWAVTGAVKGAFKGVTGVVTGVGNVGQSLVNSTTEGFKNMGLLSDEPSMMALNSTGASRSRHPQQYDDEDQVHSGDSDDDDGVGSRAPAPDNWRTKLNGPPPPADTSSRAQPPGRRATAGSERAGSAGYGKSSSSTPKDQQQQRAGGGGGTSGSGRDRRGTSGSSSYLERGSSGQVYERGGRASQTKSSYASSSAGSSVAAPAAGVRGAKGKGPPVTRRHRDYSDDSDY